MNLQLKNGRSHMNDCSTGSLSNCEAIRGSIGGLGAGANVERPNLFVLVFDFENR